MVSGVSKGGRDFRKERDRSGLQTSSKNTSGAKLFSLLAGHGLGITHVAGAKTEARCLDTCRWTGSNSGIAAARYGRHSSIVGLEILIHQRGGDP